MATSGTTTYAPEIAELIDEAYERIGIDPSTLTVRHLRSARMSLNLLFVEWANNPEGIHLWAVEAGTQALVAGTANYTLATDTVAILDAYIRRDGIDTPVLPITRDQYAALPDKTTEGLPTNYYLERRRDAPVLFLWDVPENATDVFHYYRVRRLQDVGVGSNTPDVPYRFYEALTAGLAKKLAEKFNPEREQAMSSKAKARAREAGQEDRERAPTTMRVQYKRMR